MPISLRVNTSTRQNVGQEHTVFSTSLLQNHISKSYQKIVRPILLRLLTTIATCQEKVFGLTLKVEQKLLKVFSIWKHEKISTRNGIILGDVATSFNTNLFYACLVKCLLRLFGEDFQR